MGGPVHFPSPHAPALDNDQTGALLDPRLDDEPLGAHVLGGPPSPLVSFQGSFHDGPTAGMPRSPLLLRRIHNSPAAVLGDSMRITAAAVQARAHGRL